MDAARGDRSAHPRLHRGRARRRPVRVGRRAAAARRRDGAAARRPDAAAPAAVARTGRRRRGDSDRVRGDRLDHLGRLSLPARESAAVRAAGARARVPGGRRRCAGVRRPPASGRLHARHPRARRRLGGARADRRAGSRGRHGRCGSCRPGRVPALRPGADGARRCVPRRGWVGDLRHGARDVALGRDDPRARRQAGQSAEWCRERLRVLRPRRAGSGPGPVAGHDGAPGAGFGALGPSSGSKFPKEQGSEMPTRGVSWNSTLSLRAPSNSVQATST